MGVVTITTARGLIKLSSTAEQFGALSKAAGSAAGLLTIIDAGSDFVQFKHNEIGAGRFAYRMTGHTATLFSGVLADAIMGSEAGPWRTAAGIVIGLATPAGEVLYDKFQESEWSHPMDFLHKYLIDPLASYDKWTPFGQ